MLIMCYAFFSRVHQVSDSRFNLCIVSLQRTNEGEQTWHRVQQASDSRYNLCYILCFMSTEKSVTRSISFGLIEQRSLYYFNLSITHEGKLNVYVWTLLARLENAWCYKLKSRQFRTKSRVSNEWKLTRPSVTRHPTKDLDPHSDGHAVTHMYMFHVPHTALSTLGLQWQRTRR